MSNQEKKRPSLHELKDKLSEQIQTMSASRKSVDERNSDGAYTALPRFEESSSHGKSFFKWLGIISLVAVAGVGFSYYSKSHRAPATVNSATTQDNQKHIDVRAADLDLQTTNAVREKILRGEKIQLLQGNPGLQYSLPRPAEQAQLEEKIKDGKAKYYTIKIVDSVDVDGDVVEISVDGVKLGFVTLDHAGTVISLPLEANISSVFTVKGVFDGGGGITFGAELQTSVVNSVLEPGQLNNFDLRFY